MFVTLAGGKSANGHSGSPVSRRAAASIDIRSRVVMLPEIRPAYALTLWAGMRSISFRLWDEQRKRLVGYWRLRDIRDHKSGQP